MKEEYSKVFPALLRLALHHFKAGECESSSSTDVNLFYLDSSRCEDQIQDDFKHWYTLRVTVRDKDTHRFTWCTAGMSHNDKNPYPNYCFDL